MEGVFVDDLFTRTPKVEKALELKRNVVGPQKRVRFELKKSSNSEECLYTFYIPPDDKLSHSNFKTNEISTIKILGVKRCFSTDTLMYQV